MNAPSHFIYLIRPPRPSFVHDATEQEQEIMGRHSVYLKELLGREKLLLAGPCLDGAFGVAILRTSDADEARRLMQGDPAVVTGLVSAELHPMRMSLLAT